MTCALLIPAVAHAGAWLAPEGGGQVVVTTHAAFADRAYTSGWNTQATPAYSKVEAQALFEYGVTDWFTAIAMPTLQGIDIAAPTTARRGGFGYSDFGGRIRVLASGPWVISAQATIRVPGTRDSANPAAIGYTGIEVDARALVGVSFAVADMPAFVNVEAAQRFRNGAPPGEFRADLTFGVRPWARWLFMAQSFSVIAESAGAPPFTRYAYHKLQLSAAYDLTRSLTLQVGGYATYAGTNALQESGALLGAWYRF